MTFMLDFACEVTFKELADDTTVFSEISIEWKKLKIQTKLLNHHEWIMNEMNILENRSVCFCTLIQHCIGSLWSSIESVNKIYVNYDQRKC